ncbi:MAG: LuxR C-terminal-related transcriptional regulator [Pseudomonadota bacterium]
MIQQQLLENFPGYVFWKDNQSTYLGSNQYFAKAAGFNHPDELIGLKDTDLPWCELAAQMSHADRLAIDQPQMILEIPLIADASCPLVITQKKPLYDHNTLIGMIGFSFVNQTKSILAELSRLIGNLKNYKDQNFLVQNDSNSKLTRRQQECLYYLLRGNTIREIAKNLNLSARTIETHMVHIKNIFAVRTKSQLIEKAIEQGYLNCIPRSLLNKLI